jgi:hypothetical protein
MSSGIVGWAAAALVLARSGCPASTEVVDLGRGALGGAVLAIRAGGYLFESGRGVVGHDLPPGTVDDRDGSAATGT